MIFKSNYEKISPFVIVSFFLVNIASFILFFLVLTFNTDLGKGFIVNTPTATNPILIIGNNLNLSVFFEKNSQKQPQVVSYFNEQIIPWEKIEQTIIDYIQNNKSIITNTKEKIALNLRMDKNIPYKYLIEIYSIATKIGLLVNNVVQVTK